MPKPSIFEITVELHRSTDKAIQVSEDGGATLVWLPKSQIEYEFKHGHANLVIVTAPEWLIRDKGLTIDA